MIGNDETKGWSGLFSFSVCDLELSPLFGPELPWSMILRLDSWVSLRSGQALKVS